LERRKIATDLVFCGGAGSRKFVRATFSKGHSHRVAMFSRYEVMNIHPALEMKSGVMYATDEAFGLV
jgi:hypothetical protein